MRLRKQLMFLSLVTLSLPWVGCQYIREMDSSLRRGQSEALTATAQAVSARISSDDELRRTLEPYVTLTNPVYANTLLSALYLDGYDDDWISQGFSAQALPGDSDVDSIFGVYDNKLYALLRMRRDSLHYFNPSQNDLRAADHVLLGFQHNRYALFASAPGQLKAVRWGEDAGISAKTIEHQIKGFWLERPDGYQIEFSLPWSWLRGGIQINIQSPSSTNSRNLPRLQPVIAESPLLAQELAVFASSGLRLHVVSTSAHRIAHSGSLQLRTTSPQRHGFIEWLYGLALGKNKLPRVDANALRGQVDDADVYRSLQGDVTQNWYRLGNQSVTRISLPIYAPKSTQVIGAVIAEKSAQSLAEVTDTAFSRLLAYSFLVSSFAALSLVGYATWLSLRIRRLSEATASAVTESGKINENFPVSQSADELGELSRNYAQLLSRLREYTHYLRTLSSKLSHELRTPLAIVRSSLDNLEHERLSRQAKIYADRAREGTTRLSNILNAMSAASRVEQAIGGAERESIPCDELLRSLQHAYSDVYQHVNFQLNIRPDAKGFMIHGSGELLVQALDKLVDNAADFCPQSGLIELGLYRHNNDIVITVRNEGPPLPSHMHGQLFDSMVSVRDAPSTEQSHHLGLGLYIVRLITDFHHGEVNAYNVPDNSGVIFELRLPAEGQIS